MSLAMLVLFLLTIVYRILSMFLLNPDPHFFLSPRNFNGHGLVIVDNYWELVFLVIVFVALLDVRKLKSFKSRGLVQSLSLWLVVLVPLVTGLLLPNYREKLFFIPSFNLAFFLRWVEFVLTFWIINLFADRLNFKSNFTRSLVIFIFVFFLAILQDVPLNAGSMYTFFSLINSIGLSSALLALAARKIYKNYPLETVIMAAIIGLFVNFILISARSSSYFTVFLPMIAMYLTALVLYLKLSKIVKIVLISLPVVLAVFLNYALPAMLPEDVAKQMVEKGFSDNLSKVQVGEVTVKYGDERLKGFAIQLARVIDAANKISEKEFGISPKVKELTILGFAPGGFHGQFPDKIIGNIISPKYLEFCSDSAFLNDPQLPANFLDPVNGILHEYSHLYGAVPYNKWIMGPEEEGWATFSATVLSKLLYKYYGDTLWKPGYNYSRQADKITKLNLSGKAVVWSHPYEFGGFQLWYNLARDEGLKKLYIKRWRHTFRNLFGIVLLESDPKKALNLVKAFGKKKFEKYGKHKPVKFSDIYSLDDYLYMAKVTGMDKQLAVKLYKMRENTIIDPSVPIPKD